MRVRRYGDPNGGKYQKQPTPRATCSVEGCSRSVRAKGLCKPHYNRMLRSGDPLGAPPRRVDLATRLLARVNKNGSTPADLAQLGSCWTWIGSKVPGGYGRIRVEGETLYTHRVSYELHVGPIPPGLELDHLCRNRSCCNPAHLEPVTAAENQRRAVAVRANRATS